MSDADNYQAAMYEIGEIVRIARDNPKGLRNFLMANYPKEWGLTKEQHQTIITGARGYTTPRHSYDRSDPERRCKYCGDPCPYGHGPRKRPCPGTTNSKDEQS